MLEIIEMACCLVAMGHLSTKIKLSAMTVAYILELQIARHEADRHADKQTDKLKAILNVQNVLKKARVQLSCRCMIAFCLCL